MEDSSIIQKENFQKRLTFPSIPYIIIKVCTGDVPKWLKGPHSKCGRSGNRREGSNPSISVFLVNHNRKHFYLYFMYKKRFHILTIVCFICIIATVMKTQLNLGDWSNGMIGVSKTFGGSSILSSPAVKNAEKPYKSRLFSVFDFP